MAAHAKLFSFSKAPRWIPCPGSITLEAPYEDKGNDAADWGTDAHELASRVFAAGQGVQASDLIGTTMPLGNVVDEAMAEMVQGYVDYTYALARGVPFGVEERVELRAELGLPDDEDDGFGTADVIIPLVEDDELIVEDLKTGYHGVEPTSEQLKLYGAAALKKYDMMHDWKRVRLVIYQPKCGGPREHVMTVEEVWAFVAEAKAAVQTALLAKKYADNWVGKDDAKGYLVPGEKQCKYCRALAVCPVAARKVEEDVGAMFDTIITGPGPQSLVPSDGETLAKKLATVDYIESWISAIRGAVETLLLKGEPVPGYKLVMGKMGNRKWSDPDAAVKMLKSFRWKTEDIFKMTPITPTQAIKALKEEPKRVKKLETLIVQEPGQPSVAPSTDPRPPLVLEDAGAGFEDATDCSDLM